MDGIRSTIAIGAFIVLAVLGTGWALERVSGVSHRSGGGAVLTPTSDTVTAPAPEQFVGAPAIEFDRSDLILSQG
jgi:hypothetical protein